MKAVLRRKNGGGGINPIHHATKRIRNILFEYLGINLPKETKELYTENYKTLMKEIKDNIKRWRYSKFLGRKNQYCENDYNTNAIYRFNVIPIKLPDIFHRTRRKNFTTHVETQKTPNSQSSPEKEEQSWRYQTPDSKSYYKTIEIKTIWY